MTNKGNKVLGMINHTFKYLDKNSLKLLFTSLVWPQLEYAAPIWNPHSNRIGKIKQTSCYDCIMYGYYLLLTNFWDMTYTSIYYIVYILYTFLRLFIKHSVRQCTLGCVIFYTILEIYTQFCIAYENFRWKYKRRFFGNLDYYYPY